MSIEYFILRIPAILIALTFHEYAHGYVAYRLGDPTARNAGRLTLNPLGHLDPFGAIMLLFGPFGWAKPVPVNGAYFSHPKRDTLLVSLAGPVSNIIIALIFGYSVRVLDVVAPQLIMTGYLGNFLSLCIIINIGISFFNLLPVPPLDGSHILASLLPNHMIRSYYEKMKYIPTIFMVMLVAEWGLKIPIFSTLINPLFRPFAAFWFFLMGLPF